MISMETASMETLRKILRTFFIVAAILSFQGWIVLGAYEVGLQDGKTEGAKIVGPHKPEKKYLLQVINV